MRRKKTLKQRGTGRKFDSGVNRLCYKNRMGSNAIPSSLFTGVLHFLLLNFRHTLICRIAHIFVNNCRSIEQQRIRYTVRGGFFPPSPDEIARNLHLSSSLFPGSSNSNDIFNAVKKGKTCFWNSRWEGSDFCIQGGLLKRYLYALEILLINFLTNLRGRHVSSTRVCMGVGGGSSK